MINSSFGLGSFSRAAERATIKLWRLGKLKLQAPHVYGITVISVMRVGGRGSGLGGSTVHSVSIDHCGGLMRAEALVRRESVPESVGRAASVVARSVTVFG